MEYRRAYRDEAPDQELIARHEREIFPLLKKRRLFAGSENFALYDLYTPDGFVNENVFAYSNRLGDERALVFYNNSFHRASGWIRNAVPSTQKGPNGTKILQHKNLAEALGLSNNPNCFTLLREQRSDRWFIRSSREISEKGLFIALDGYQSQVFLDIHEIEDNQLGHWRRLNDELAGRGVPDLHAAFQDLFLRDLYSALKELVKPSYFNGFYSFFNPEQKAPKAAPFIEMLREPTLRYIRIAREYLDGASGRYESFERKQEYSTLEAEQVWDSFAQSMQRFIKLGEYIEKPPANLQSSGRTFVASLYKALSEDPRISAYIAGYLVLALNRGIIGVEATGEDARRLVDHWCLDRKLRESYQDAGFPPDESYHVVELLKLILSRTMNEDQSLFQGPSISFSITSHLFTEEAFKAFLNVNLYNDVLWFNKEKFEQILLYAGIIAAIESDEAALPPKRQEVQSSEKKGSIVLVPHPSKLNTAQWSKRLEMIAQIQQELSNAMVASGYKVEVLLNALRPRNVAASARIRTTKRSTTKPKTEKE